MQDNTIGVSVGTTRMFRTIVQIDTKVVVVEAANRIGVEAEVSDAITIIIIQADAIFRIIMAGIIKARCNHNVNNTIMKKEDCLSQMVPQVPQQYHLIVIIKLRPEPLRHKAM